MATVPGHAGFTLVGDKSLEFYRDAVLFVDKRIEQFQSRVFLSRLLNKHTVFVASNAGVKQVLNGKDLTYWSLRDAEVIYECIFETYFMNRYLKHFL